MSVSASTQGTGFAVARIRGAINAHPRTVIAVGIAVAVLDAVTISTALGL